MLTVRQVTPQRVIRAFRSPNHRFLPLQLFAIALYLVMVVSGSTTSSLSGPNERVSAQLSSTIGTPRGVRSDEWLVQTPYELWTLSTGSVKSATPMSQQLGLIYQIPAGGIAENVVFFDGAALKLGPELPDAMLFAARWWLPVLILLLAFPSWLVRIGSRRSVAVLATGLIALSPSVAWWSMMPIRCGAYTVAGCLLVMSGIDRWLAGKRVIPLLMFAVAGVLFARLPTYYVPWSITIGLPVLTATALWIFLDPARRRAGLAAVATSGVVSGVLFGGLVVENADALRAELNTVYPGTRTSGGHSRPWGAVFGAPIDWALQNKHPLSQSNQSELSSAYSVAGVLALVLAPFVRRGRRDPQTWAIAALGAWTVLWLVWCLVDLGSWSAHLPVINRVLPERAAQTVGISATMFLAPVLSRYLDAPRRPVAIGAALLCGAISLIAGFNARSRFFHTLPVSGIVVSSLIVVAAILAVTLVRRTGWTVLPILVLVATVVWQANPLQIGLGDLKNSTTAKDLAVAGARDRKADVWWATDTMFTDALLLSNGVPSISGHQVTGPNDDQWHILDPTDQYKQVWNRGASYIVFHWLPQGSAPTIKQGSTKDVIHVGVDPCSAVVRLLGIQRVVSQFRLHNSCLRPTGQFVWARRRFFEFQRTDG